MPSDEEQGRQTAPKSDDHPGLDTDEVTDKGKMMTGVGSLGPEADAAQSRPTGSPTLADHPGLETDEAMPEGTQMTALGSTRPAEGQPAEAEDDRGPSGRKGH